MKQGFVTAAAEVDHIVPLFRGGTDAPGNLQSLCVPCHEAKTRDDFGQRQSGCDLFGSPLESR
ncbi:HNH endonuclease [Paraburkholderia sp. MM5477-R1]|uniref:HNH endonuclease n=1 Tax=Paraburkholderia sp. MM5477-R1 TaxID=2991062 RepID=UPI003D1CC344